MSYHCESTHWVRVLPDGTREIWQAVPADSPPAPSDLTHSEGRGRVRWVPLVGISAPDEQGVVRPTIGQLVCVALDLYLDAIGDRNPQPVDGLPCRCFTVTTEQHDDGPVTVKETREVRDISDHNNGRPFMARFSWTIGLPWEPPVRVVIEGDKLTIHDRETGKLIATSAKPGLTAEQAMIELRAAKY